VTTARPIEEIENDELIYLDVDVFDNNTLLAEQERCQEVIDQHVMAGGIDLTYWYDRVNHIEQIRSLQRVYHSVVRRDNKGT
jgi:hypothetical protein